jgi:hypothetical protein
MFIRRKRRGDKTYYSLVENYRDPETGKVRQRHVLHLPVCPAYREVFVITNGKTGRDARGKYEDKSSDFRTIEDAIDWYEYDFEMAKSYYKCAVNDIPQLREEEILGLGHFERCEKLRGEVMKLYRLLRTLREAAKTNHSDPDLAQQRNKKRQATLKEKRKWQRMLKLYDRGVSVETLMEKEYKI